ncbi:MAG: hypothetical protein J6W64_06885 [Bacilli bacterium]|nr:hypothetical protein [Bacilli bacterium]
MYPEYAEINGKQYKIDTNFETALRCFEVVEDETITNYERALAVCYLLFDYVPKDDEINAFLDKAKYYLQCGETYEEQTSKNRDMDFIQDRRYINSSFMKEYKIDLSKEKLHFWQFIEDIEGLGEDTALNRIRDIRNRDLKEIKDAKEKQRVKEAQERFKLKETHSNKKFTLEEQENMNSFFKQMEVN